jgi:hypothetical protein
MGYQRALFVREASVEGYDCAVCLDVVEEPVQCLQGHTCVFFCGKPSCPPGSF